MDKHEVELIIEAALLTSHEPMDRNALRSLFEPKLSPDFLEDVVDSLKERWNGRAVFLEETATGYAFKVDERHARLIPHLYEERNPKFSMPVLETLTIIAYHQPVTRMEIEEIRGVQVSSHIIQLLTERGWIEVLGQKDTIGRPKIYGTSKQFLSDFGLSSLEELPDIESLAELFESEKLQEMTRIKEEELRAEEEAEKAAMEGTGGSIDPLEFTKREGNGSDEHLSDDEAASPSEEESVMFVEKPGDDYESDDDYDSDSDSDNDGDDGGDGGNAGYDGDDGEDGDDGGGHGPDGSGGTKSGE